MPERLLRVNGARLPVTVTGDGPLVLCLHGFPDTRDSFRELVPALVAAGYRVAVPVPRALLPAHAARVADCRLDQLARDALALITALGYREAVIIGHDWGAVTAYAAAALAPDTVGGLVCAAVPHPRRFLSAGPRQWRRSWYIGLFQLPLLPEPLIVAGGSRFLHRLWRAWSPGWSFDEAQFAAVRQCFAQPGVARSALAWYRAVGRALFDPGVAGLRRQLLRPCTVPTLSIAGADDGCIGVETFAGQGRWHRAGFEQLILENAGHFMHREQPQRFADAVLGFLGSLQDRP